AGGELPRSDSSNRRLARGAQIRRIQPHVGVCSPRPEEPCCPAFVAAAERRATPEQSRVSTRYAHDGGERRRTHEQVDAAIENGRDACREAATRRSGNGDTRRLCGQVGTECV